MTTAQIISIIISIAAFIVAAYGIIERRMAAARAERLRLTTIAENLVQLRKELLELSERGVMSGNAVEVVSARMELLGQQAISLVQQHSLTITSAECREIASCLEQTGFVHDAEFMWDTALERSRKEGDVQEFYASRGYAYFLFRQHRETEARETLRDAMSRYIADTELKTLAHVETLVAWSVWETSLDESSTQNVAELKKRIADLENSFHTVRGQQMYANTTNGIELTSIENPQP